MGTEADLVKQSCWAEAKAAEEGKIISATELSGKHRNRMIVLSPSKRKFLVLFSRKAGE